MASDGNEGEGPADWPEPCIANARAPRQQEWSTRVPVEAPNFEVCTWAIACASRPPNRACGSSCASASVLFSTSIPLCASQTHPFSLHHSSIAITSTSNLSAITFPHFFPPSLPPFLTSFLFVCIVLHCIAELSMCTMVRGLGAQWWERGGSCCQCCASGQQYRSLWARVGPIWSKREGGVVNGTWFAACCRGYP